MLSDVFIDSSKDFATPVLGMVIYSFVFLKIVWVCPQIFFNAFYNAIIIISNCYNNFLLDCIIYFVMLPSSTNKLLILSW